MTRTQALTAARREARKSKDLYYVVYEAGEYDAVNAFDLDTFYMGARPELCVAPDGEVFAE